MGILLTDNGLLAKGRAMATALIAGRVSEDVKERADFFIRRAGLTTSEVVRIVWENIARTGEVPRPEHASPAEQEETAAEDNPLMQRYLYLRSITPRSEYLENLTPEGLRRALRERYDDQL